MSALLKSPPTLPLTAVRRGALVAFDRLERATLATKEKLPAALPSQRETLAISLMACAQIAVTAGRLALNPSVIAEQIHDSAAAVYGDVAVQEMVDKLGRQWATECEKRFFGNAEGLAAAAGVAVGMAIVVFDLMREASDDGGPPADAFVDAFTAMVRTGLERLACRKDATLHE